jgi:hypothetical protein
MLLGMGLNGNVSRCFYYFQDFAQCMKKEDDIQKVKLIILMMLLLILILILIL